jgi:hypothetical protein
LKSKSSVENGDSENILKKAEEGLNGLAAFTTNFSLGSTIITDHDPTAQINESTNSLAMLEKKTQEVLNSASQGILSNNLLDELAFANDKGSPNGRSDTAADIVVKFLAPIHRFKFTFVHIPANVHTSATFVAADLQPKET